MDRSDKDALRVTRREQVLGKDAKMSGLSNGRVRIVTCAAAFVLVLIVSGLLAPLPAERARATNVKPVSEWTPDDYQHAFDRIEADHSSPDPVVRSRADAAVARGLNSLPNAGIDSGAAADLVSRGSTDTVMANVM